MDLNRRRRRWTRTRGPLHRGSAVFTAGSLVASLLLSSVIAGTALAADTAAKAPTATQAPNQWTSPTNAFANDGVYASEAADNDEQGYGGFGFSVPAGSIIDGITVKVEARSTDSSGCDLQVALSWNDGSNYTSFKTADLTDSDTVFPLGGAADAWGHVWDPTELNGHFRLKTRNEDPGNECANSGDEVTRVDYITVAVSYRTITPGTVNAALTSEICQAADFSFVVDMSGSIGAQGQTPSNLPDLITGIKGFVKAFQDNGGDGRYAGVQFNNTSASNPTAGFLSDSNFTSWVNALASPNGSTPTAAGIDAGRGNTAGDRSGVPNIMFVVTDGSPNVPGGSMSSPPTWLSGADAAIASANTTRATGIPGGGKWIVNAVYLSTAGDPGDTNLPFSPAGDAQWASAVMTQIGGGSYLPGDFKSFANDLLNSIGCKPGLNLVKSADKTELPVGGGVVSYTFTLTNAGNQPLSEITLKDEITGTSTAACGPISGPTGDANSDKKLDQTEKWLYACSATITKDTANTATADSKETAPATATWSVTVAKPARLTLVKNVSGGQATASDWTLTATGPTTISGKTGDAAITNASVAAGTYALSESTGPANYVAGSWSCGDAAMDGASVSLKADESATCTITNTYNPPEPETGSLKITKKLTGDLTGFAGGDFTFSVTCDDKSYGPVKITLSSGSASASPITGIPAGADCTVNETDKPLAGTYAGWDAPTYSPSTTVPIVSGQEATVEVTNNRTYAPPSPGYGTIIIEKQTTPEGSSQEFTFSSELADGTFTLSDGETETFNELRPGTYGVEEVNLPDGWTLAGVTGDEGCRLGQPSLLDTAFVADAPQSGSLVSIYVGAGETVRCVFNNRGPEASPTPPPSIQIPRINVEKSASASSVVAGTAVTYTYKVTNTSIDALLTDIKVSDDKCSPATYVSGDDGDTFLQIGETWTYTCTTTLTATTTNTVTATGAWRGQTVTDDAQATVTVTPGAVAGATATPRVTPPPTATAGNQENGNPGSTLGVALAALALFGLVLGALAPKPARARRRSR